MAEENKTALVFGATGLTGSYLVEELLKNPHIEKVKIFVRNRTSNDHLKLEQILFDFSNWENIEQHFTPLSIVFCTTGTTTAKTPDKKEYYAIEYGIPTAIAGICARRSVLKLLVMSSIGADVHSRYFYLKTKAEMENAVQSTGIKMVHIFRPSLLLGPRKEMRFGEKLAVGLDFLFRPLMIGKLRRYRGIEAQQVARAMVTVALGKTVKVIFESDEIAEIK